MSELTQQESLFLDRIALYLAAAGDEVCLAGIEQAARQVLEDDTRLLQTLCKNETLRSDAITHLSARVHDELRRSPEIRTR